MLKPLTVAAVLAAIAGAAAAAPVAYTIDFSFAGFNNPLYVDQVVTGSVSYGFDTDQLLSPLTDGPWANPVTVYEFSISGLYGAGLATGFDESNVTGGFDVTLGEITSLAFAPVNGSDGNGFRLVFAGDAAGSLTAGVPLPTNINYYGYFCYDTQVLVDRPGSDGVADPCFGNFKTSEYLPPVSPPVAQTPLPAGLPALLTALGGLWLVRRRAG